MKKVLVFSIAFLSIIAAISWDKKEGKNGNSSSSFTIGLPVTLIDTEYFTPDTAVFRVVSVNDSLVQFYYWLHEYTSGASHSGETVRTGNAWVPKALVLAIDPKIDGTVGDTTALNMLLGAFNLRKRYN